MHGEGSCAERGVRFVVSETIFIHTVWRAVAIKLKLIIPWLMESCNIITLSGAYDIVQYSYFDVGFQAKCLPTCKEAQMGVISKFVCVDPSFPRARHC